MCNFEMYFFLLEIQYVPGKSQALFQSTNLLPNSSRTVSRYVIFRGRGIVRSVWRRNLQNVKQQLWEQRGHVSAVDM